MRNLFVGISLFLTGAALIFTPSPSVYMEDGRDSALINSPPQQPLSFVSYALNTQDTDIPDSFDDPSRKPRSIYNPKADKTRVRLRRNPRLDQELVHIVTDPETLSVREDPIGSNWGSSVKKYLEYCNVHQPAWWCAAFVSYEIHQASINSGVRASWPAFASCNDIFNWGRRHNLLLIEPGVPSVMLIRGNPKKHERLYKHTGIVVGYDPVTKTITTVEGNSNNNGSKNGIGVFQLHRTVKDGRMVFVKVS